MPGIVGLITRMPRQQAERELHLMVQSLRHEAFYQWGTWVDEAAGVYVGWVAHKGSFCDRMPLRNERGDLCLVFAGEEFPEPGVAQRLSGRGHQADQHPASYLVHLCEEEPSFPANLNGRFHGLLTDRTRGTAMLFNDRCGMHRIYYHEGAEAFYFAAEAKAILAVRSELRSLDPEALGEYIACGCTLNNRSLFNKITILPPASAWTFRGASLERKGAYFQPQEWEDQPRLEPEAFYQELRDVFVRNLPRYFQGREPVAISLTGGVDSRMIMAWNEQPPQSLPCYTFGGIFRDSRDVRLAQQVADACRQPYQVIRVADEFLSRFPDYAERAVYLTDGCASVMRASNVYVNQVARGIAPVRMTGNYGGEVLRRLRMFKPIEPAPGLFSSDVIESVQQAKITYDGLRRCHPLTFAVFRQAPWHHYGLMALEESQIGIRTPFLDNDLVRTAFRAPDSVCTSKDLCLRLIADGKHDLGRIPTDQAHGKGRRGRVAAALSRRLHTFTFKAEYAYDYGMPQWVAQIDHLLSPLHLERLFLGRHKYYHYRVWYRDVFADYLRQMLLDRRTLSRPYLGGKTVEEMVNRHTRGDRNYTWEIHTVLTLELLHRSLIESAPSLVGEAAALETARP